jgi:hypothetical protein
MEDTTHGFADEFKEAESTDSGKNMRGIGALFVLALEKVFVSASC